MPQSEFRDRGKLKILAAAIMVHLFSGGLPFSMGVLYFELLEEFKESREITAAVMTTCIGMKNIGGKLKYRKHILRYFLSRFNTIMRFILSWEEVWMRSTFFRNSYGQQLLSIVHCTISRL